MRFDQMPHSLRVAYGRLGGQISNALYEEGLRKPHRFNTETGRAAAYKSHPVRRQKIAQMAEMTYEECWNDYK